MPVEATTAPASGDARRKQLHAGAIEKKTLVWLAQTRVGHGIHGNRLAGDRLRVERQLEGDKQRGDVGSSALWAR